MPRFFKTINEIVDTQKYTKILVWYDKIELYIGDSILKTIDRADVLEESDNLEELCDDFILASPYRFRKPKTATELEKDFEEMKEFYTSSGDIIYGAIWCTGLGIPHLKSVAKYDKEMEELKLL